MVDTTPTLGLPYPQDTDRIWSWPATVQDLAEAIEANTVRVGRTKATGQAWSASEAAILFDTAAGTDQSGMTYSAGTFTVTKAGLWHIDCLAALPTGSGGATLKLRLNTSTEVVKSIDRVTTTAGWYTTLTLACNQRLAVGDTLQVTLQFDAPSVPATNTWGSGWRFDAFRIGA